MNRRFSSVTIMLWTEGLLITGSIRKVSGLAARSVTGHPLWGRGNVCWFLNKMEVDLVPGNSQSGALNGVYQFQHIGVSHFTGPFHILTPSVPKALVPALPQAVSVTQAGTCKAPDQRSPGAP